ncbi:unnamed protein product [Spodoptera littoralis]|uniref:Brain-specific angiogenesis inhibitor 1-associated protein 2 n=1 Tax=Spodoptera littoralis TaxID=7109 RepID=A0A9P0IE76_SPOLI|nr:unnamed protein product [Spodoptera littoralis]
METEELTKLVDGIYKNILDKFNPGARQMITAGKAYLKALHGAAAASRLYVDAVGKLGRQAQQGTWGGCADIGTALMKVVEVYREIQDQQMNILKAFYVDLLVPLETNLEKDTKVVQSEQKRFLQQHKLRSESYSKAAATIKKQRKKKPNVTKVGSAMDKEMKNMQILEEEKTKLDAFCEQSLKNAMTQERRRYGFVLERQCSLAKHWLAYHTAGATAYNSGLDEWLEVSRTREFLPPNVEAMFVSRMRQVSFWADEDVYASPRVGDDDDRASVGSALRKTRSVDASCLDVRSIGDLGSPTQGLSRAKSDFNLQASSNNDDSATDTRTATRPSSLAPPTCTTRDPPLARALYAYAAAGDNQLSFQQGDVLALLGERTKGWQYGENLRSHHAGWFPLATLNLYRLMKLAFPAEIHQPDGAAYKRHQRLHRPHQWHMRRLRPQPQYTRTHIHLLVCLAILSLLIMLLRDDLVAAHQDCRRLYQHRHPVRLALQQVPHSTLLLPPQVPPLPSKILHHQPALLLMLS